MISCEKFGSLDYGRFGNQMFQYALCKILSTIHNTTFHLNPSRHFLKFFDNTKLSYQLFNPLKHKQNKKYIEKNIFTFDHKLFNNDNIDISGFFQNIQYYEKFNKEIVNEFTPNEKILNNTKSYINIKSKNAPIQNIACAHVRRTDYKQYKKKYIFLDYYYYKNIIKKINYDYLFIISDDIDEVEKEFTHNTLNLKNIIFVKELDVYHQFYIMYLARQNILTNSTFSWWSAYLSDLKFNDKTIYAPKIWSNQYDVNLYPKQWNKIEYTTNKWETLFRS